jgi:hypothetical protein
MESAFTSVSHRRFFDRLPVGLHRVLGKIRLQRHHQLVASHSDSANRLGLELQIASELGIICGHFSERGLRIPLAGDAKPRDPQECDQIAAIVGFRIFDDASGATDRG